MANKIIGYILSIVGILVISVGSVKPLRASLAFIPAAFKDIYIMGIGLLMVVIGIIMLYDSTSNQKVTEVPIYHGKEVVGFRRLGKK